MRSGPLPSARSSGRRRGLAFFLAVALVTVQMLGIAHRVVHADRDAHGQAFSTVPAPSHAINDGASLSHASWISAIFADRDPGHDCDAFDAMSHADLVVDLRLDAVPVSGTASVHFMHAAWHLAAQARGFLARAPPPAA